MVTKSTGSSEIARIVCNLMRRDGVNVSQLSAMTSIPASTLYAMLKKNTNEADFGNLKKIAAAFGENISVFCGADGYVRSLEPEEEQLLNWYRRMNRAGQARLLEYAAEIGEHPRYLAHIE